MSLESPAVVSGRLLDSAGRPLVGVLSFTPDTTIMVDGATVTTNHSVQVPLDVEGEFSVELLGNDVEGLVPQGFTYRIEFELYDAGREYQYTAPFSFSAPSGAAIPFESIVPITPNTGEPVTAGPTGPQGPEGPQGPPGEDGVDGMDGLPGADGADGADGAAGPQGPVGPAGPVGPVGPAGEDGEPGPAGEDGVAGAAGAAGATGPAGPEGPIGPAGPTGDTGPTGETGPAGPEGPAGADGEAGPEGPQGEPGPAGADGAAGHNPITVSATEPSSPADGDVWFDIS